MTAQPQTLVSGLQLWQWRHQALQAANAAGVSASEVDWLLQEIAGLDRLALRLESFKDWQEIQLTLPLEDLNKLWLRRVQDRLPVQYITGVTPWRQFKIAVSPAVLIPRPETECLIDLAVLAAQKSNINQLQQPEDWVDLGTGSGAIAIGLANVFRKSTIHAVDCSTDALAIAEKNAQTAGFADRIRFYQGSWWQPMAHLKGQIAGLVSNPPYIPTSVVADLQPEVVKHEPLLALDGGTDGLDYIRYLIDTSPTYLRPGGVWLIEMMTGQAEIVCELLQKQGNYCNIEIHADLAGIHRFALANIKNLESVGAGLSN
jgi:release factor glutamine methyltransferase